MNIPESIRETVAAGMMHARAGRIAEAVQSLQRALAIQEDPTTRLLLASLLPVVYISKDEVVQFRDRLMQYAAQMKMYPRLDLTNNWAVPLFHSAYQGYNDRDLQKQWSELFAVPRDAMLPGSVAGANGRRIKIGIISAYFKDHTIGLLNRGLVARLPRDRFSVTVFTTRRQTDYVVDYFRDHADAYVELPNQAAEARRMISQQKPDVLYFTDLGMDPMTYTLAQTRYAPVQCTTWGHPVTSGLNTIDYFISTEALETENSKDHYTEQLVRLSRLAIYYYRPKQPVYAPIPQTYGLPPNAHYYGCPQSLYKMHPDFDPVLAAILRADPAGVLVLLKPAQMEWQQRLTDRFVRTMPDVFNRIIWVPRQNREGFLGLLRLLHVSLDPLHFGGGNTSYESLAMGTPVVTMPMDTMRSRLTHAMYQQMNYPDMSVQSPDDYVRTALRLGTDAVYLASVRSRILESCSVLFEDQHAVDELGNFFIEAVGKARQRMTPQEKPLL